MKKFIFPAIALLALFMASCSTKFNIAAPYKNITVVDGLLDKADTAHYIRIEKAFLDQNKSALTMAQNADSSFYSNISVKMEQVDFLNGGAVINTFPLTRVDMNLEGYQKASGVFFNAPNYGYKFKNTLDPNYSYRLVITNLSTGEVDSAETPVIDDSHTSSLPAFYVQMLDGTNLAGIDFHTTTSGSASQVEIHCSYSVPSNYSFFSQATQTTQTTPLGVAQAIITFSWLDSNLSTGAETRNSFNYDAGYDYTFSNNAFTFQISDLSLYYALAGNMKAAPTGIARVMLPCTIAIYVSTPDFASYMQIAATEGTGLTANQIEPVYTNISGANTVGLFAARGERSGTILITQTTIDSLQVNPITSPLNIVGNIP